MGGVFPVTFPDIEGATAAIHQLENAGFTILQRAPDVWEISSSGRSLLAQACSEASTSETVVFLTSASVNPLRLWKDRSLFLAVHEQLSQPRSEC